jgi:hypothetical protein
MRVLSYRYSVDYNELEEIVTSEFDHWLRDELEGGGVNELHVARKIARLLGRHVPTSPRQLLELAMQCEALLDARLDEPLVAESAADLYDGLRLATVDQLGEILWAHWRDVRERDARSVDEMVNPRAGDGGESDTGSPATVLREATRPRPERR